VGIEVGRRIGGCACLFRRLTSDSGRAANGRTEFGAAGELQHEHTTASVDPDHDANDAGSK
jgi:hypothetical protein